LIDELSDFDSPTAFAAGVNSVTASLNNRKDLLASLGVLNKVGFKQDGVSVADGTLWVGGRPLAEIDEALHEHGLGDLTLIPTAAFRRKLGRTYSDLSETGVELINPAPVPRLLGDKALQYFELYDSRLAVPPFQPLDHYLGDGRAEARRQIRRDFLADAPLVLKARSATQGRGIWFYPGGVEAFVADWRQGSAPSSFTDAPREFLLQYAVPHDFDRRVIAAGPTPVSGEDRYGSPETDKSNLNLVDLDADSPRGVAAELLELGAVDALDLSDPDPAVERAVADLYDAVRDLATVPESELHTWIGWDFLVVDPEDERLRALPPELLAELLDERYRTREGNYLVFGEGNLSPGSKERYVNWVAHGREGLTYDSAANLCAYGQSIACGESFDPGVPTALDPEELTARYEP
jgi:hypothetical protein